MLGIHKCPDRYCTIDVLASDLRSGSAKAFGRAAVFRHIRSSRIETDNT
jgi:hypothetical protein